jgi:hypothetical protein
MISDSFDERTIANMEVALDRACESLPHGGDHTARWHIAGKILESARKGDTTLAGLTAAGRVAVIELSVAAS